MNKIGEVLNDGSIFLKNNLINSYSLDAELTFV